MVPPTCEYPARAARSKFAIAIAGVVWVGASLVAGCSSAEFYWQGFVGQVDLLRRAQPIDEVVASTTDAKLKGRLQRAQEIRAFASKELALPSNASYTRYSDIGRPFVTWSVFAAPPLSLKAREWCFPIAGCVNYRGYFEEASARSEAQGFRARGDDVWVQGVPAYSTLGWFDDPVLSSFVRFPDTELARMLFHELAHQVVYVKDDTIFNESFAVAVEEEGVRRWLASRAAAPDHARLAAELDRNDRLRAEFRRLIVTTRDRLSALYASEASDAEKLRGKAEAFAAMKAAYEQAKAGESGLTGYDRWFAGYDGQGPNNASLAAVSLYTERVPAFRALVAQAGGDLPTFYAKVKALAGQPKSERDAALAALAAGHPVADAVR
jgi:predicted aminopeptidase